MQTGLDTRKEVDGLDSLLFNLESETDENKEDVSKNENVRYDGFNTNTGYNNFVSMDVEIEEVDKGNEYNVKLSNVESIQELINGRGQLSSLFLP